MLGSSDRAASKSPKGDFFDRIKEDKMFKSNPKQKSNLLLTAILTAVSFFIAFSLVKYIRHGQVDLIETLIGALVFFVVYYFLGRYLNKSRERKKQKGKAQIYDQK